MDKHATDAIMEEISSTDAGPQEHVDGQVLEISRIDATSSDTNMASRTQSKTFLDLPRELRDRIYELCFFCKLYVIVFAGTDRPSGYEEGLKNPEMTAQVASKYGLFYPGSFATFGGHYASGNIPDDDSGVPSQTAMSVTSDNSPLDLCYSSMRPYDVFAAPSKGPVTTITASTSTGTNWSNSLTGILYTNKLISSEAIPYLYQSCTIFFEDLGLSKKFLDITRPKILELVSKVSIYYPDELEIVHTADDAVLDQSVAMRQLFRLLCQKIAKAMPNIKELTVWIGKIIERRHSLRHIRESTSPACRLETGRDAGCQEAWRYIRQFGRQGRPLGGR